MAHFCTCKDTACTKHPSNHDKGCDPCMAHNLQRGEVPACIWLKLSDDLSIAERYTIDGFVDFYHKVKAKEGAPED